MAQALFKSWFVDFDPVIDNALAAGNPIPDELQDRAEHRKQQLAKPDHKPLPEDIRQLFPNEFELTEEMGWVPKGWEVGSLFKSIELIGGGTPKTRTEEYWGGNIPWFSVVDAPNDSDVYVINTEKHITQAGVDNSSTKILRKGTTIISARGTVGKCALVAKPMAMNQSCYGIQGKKSFPDEYVYYLIRYRVSELQQRGHGSVFNTITRDTFESICSPLPSELVMAEFSVIVKPMFEKLLASGNQTLELAKLRDTLLPKLISGELQLASGILPDVEKDLADAIA
jgi:type I restriction enzyme S subunit